VVVAPVELRATLPYPIGINRSYSGAHGRLRKTDAAVAWEEGAALKLAAAGFSPLPDGYYWVSLYCALHTCALDADALAKSVVDAVFRTLCCDDRWLGQLTMTKVLVRHRNEQRLDVRAQIRPVKNKAAFTGYSLEALGAGKFPYGL